MNASDHPLRTAPADDEPSPYRRARATRRACEVRAWALANNLAVSRTGGLPRFVYDMYAAAHDGNGEPPGH